MQLSIRNLALVCSLSLLGCADDGFGGANNLDNGRDLNNGNNANNANNINSTNNANQTNNFVPENEEEYEFSAPAVIGEKVFVANETLNSVAVIDSGTLGVSTVPVGFRPTEVAGPSDGRDGNVWVLNAGSHTVSKIDPATLKTETFRSLRFGNAIEANLDASWAFVWFDLDNVDDEVPVQVDLASVTALSNDGAIQLATGFNVRDVTFTSDGRYALIFTDDGISRVELSTLQGDAIVPPLAIIDADPDDLETLVDPTGRWAVARADTFQGLVLVDLDSGDRTQLDLPEIPTDIDWIVGDKVLVSMPRTGLHFVASVPSGLVDLAAAISAQNMTGDMGMGDMGPDVGSMDMGTMDASDVGSDAGDVGPDMAPIESDPLPIVAGVDPVVPIVDGLGAAEVSSDGSVALLFSTLNNNRLGILLDLATYEQRRLTFEKGLEGAVSDLTGKTFVVFHSKEEGEIPPDATPIDPIYIARSWAISLVDVASAANRLILTPHETGRSTLWSEEGFVKLYLGFRIPDDEAQRVDTMKQIVVANLQTFATKTIQLASYPEGLGRIDPARRVYVSQIYEQGRLTFLNVDTDERQTVTGYQLNAGID